MHATHASATKPAAAQPASATRSPRLARALNRLASTTLVYGPLVVPQIDLRFGGLHVSDPLRGGEIQPLNAATLRTVMPGIPALDRPGGHHGTAARRVPVVGIRTADSAASPDVIQRIERVVPLGIWIGLVGALALAASAAIAMVVAGRRARRQGARLAAVSAQALTDPLTGVLNRRGFLDALERELARARRYGRPVALAYVDVRGLKAVNDSEGHLAGDELLREAAGMLEGSARADDVVGRIGGDELALLLGEQSGEGATVVANRIRAQVPTRRAALSLREPWDLTIGTASFPADGTTVDELLAAADRRLYEQRGIELR